MASSRQVLLLALACVFQMVACETAGSQAKEGATEAYASIDKTAPIGTNNNNNNNNNRIQLKQSGLLPAFLWPLKKTRQPNIFLMFFDLYEPMMPQQIKDMVDQQIRPTTDQMSEQILSSVPGAKQFYEQMSSFMQIFAQFGPQNFLGGGGGSSGSGRGNGLADMMGGFIGRP